MANDSLEVREDGDRVTFAVHVQPRASRTEIAGTQEGALRVRLTSPPVEGAANRACIEFLAKKLKVPKSAVTIDIGEKGRRKVVAVEGISTAELLEALGFHKE